MGIGLLDEYAYTGLHAYAFIEQVVADEVHPGRNLAGLIAELQEMAEPHGPGPVTSVVEVAGGFQALVHLRFEEDDLSGLQDFLASDVWNGVHLEVVVEGPTYTGPLNQLMGTKKHLCDLVALVKVWVEAGRAREVLGRLGDELGDRFHGASIVYGSFDIFLALEGPDMQSVAAAALALQNVQAISKTETSFADWRRVPWHPDSVSSGKKSKKKG